MPDILMPLVTGYGILTSFIYHDFYVFNWKLTRSDAKNLNNLHIHSRMVAAVAIGRLSLPADTIFAACKK